MDRPNGNDSEGVSVVGFEVPRSPDSSYNNPSPGPEDEAREPPILPPHLSHNLVHYPASQDDQSNLPLPHNVVLNHLYIEDRERPRTVVAMGITHRFHAKYVTVVLYKPVQRSYSITGQRGVARYATLKDRWDASRSTLEFLSLPRLHIC